MIVELNPLKWFAKKRTELRELKLPPAPVPPGPPVVADATGAAARKPVFDIVRKPDVDGLWVPGAIAKSKIPSSPQPLATQESKAAQAEESVMSNKFVGFLETVGKDFAKGLGFAVKYVAPVASLAGLLFPGAKAAAAGVVSATTLMQTAVISVEQKYAAAGVQNGTGPQKAAEVLLLTEDAVTALLKQAGITADTGYIQSLVNAVVGILNVQSPPVPA